MDYKQHPAWAYHLSLDEIIQSYPLCGYMPHNIYGAPFRNEYVAAGYVYVHGILLGANAEGVMYLGNRLTPDRAKVMDTQKTVEWIWLKACEISKTLGQEMK